MKENIDAARGLIKSELVLKNAKIINVFTEEIEIGDVAIHNGLIVGIGEYEGVKEIDCTGKYLAPGFIDGHIHIESSMMKPYDFAKTVLTHGTTCVITDPHEISNVCGSDGLQYMLEATDGLPLSVYFMLPSCVPATPLDESGAALTAKDLEGYYEQCPRAIGLAEMMNYIGVLDGDREVLRKIKDAKLAGYPVDGHAPDLTGKDLNAYLTAGVRSDHECSTAKEAKERVKKGQWLMIRQGTAAKNLKNLMPLFEKPYCYHAMLVTDDKHPEELYMEGHMDSVIRQAINWGADPILAIKMATYNPAQYFDLPGKGAVAPGHLADLVVFENLKEIHVTDVFKDGIQVVSNGTIGDFAQPIIESDLEESVVNSFHMKSLTSEDFKVKGTGDKIHVIGIEAGELLTKKLITAYKKETDGIQLDQDIIKLAVVERHYETGHIGLSYIKGYGLKQGAIASSVSHDSHNLILAGTNEKDMQVAAQCVAAQKGGWAIALDGKILESLPLPIAGLMSELPIITLNNKIHSMKETAYALGISESIDPFMTLAFLSLSVIPEIKLTTHGLVEASTQTIIPSLFY